jgi:hypothetical protein
MRRCLPATYNECGSKTASQPAFWSWSLSPSCITCALWWDSG